MRRKVLLLVLVLAGLIVAGVAYAQFYAPTVEKVLTETPLTEGAGGTAATTAVNVSSNESEENDGIPKWWHWSEQDWEKFQWYANKTEVIWIYNETTGEKVRGTVIVAGEPLCKEPSDDGNVIAPTFKGGPSPVWYLSGERKGTCVVVPRVCWMLLKVKGEEKVIRVGAIGINYNPEYFGLYHTWVEWTDSEGKQWVIDYNNVWQRDEWYRTYDWTVGWDQFPI